MRKILQANLLWLTLVCLLAAYLTYALMGHAEQTFIPGETTHGHHQIEMQCSACHTPNMGVKQESCNECHAEELRMVDDSHPVIKFKDPRNAARLAKLDARYCITCHREHQPEITNPMGVTIPEDYCYHCHEEIAEERPSHVGLPFDSCATAGCHNFHDNTALYERFLTDHLDEPDFKAIALQQMRTYYDAPERKPGEALEKLDADAPEDVAYNHTTLHTWSTTAHAAAGVNCSACHDVKDPESGQISWQNKPGYQSCQSCHSHETKGFLEGKHGMRLAAGLSPMQPSMALIPMRADAAHLELDCGSCHGAHQFDTRVAAVDSCLKCHNDEHSLAYKKSPHFQLFKQAQLGLKPAEAGVSCATCHMPRVDRTEFGETITIVDHNQSNSLRPNDKMIRSSCIECHGLQFTLNALSDRELIQRNFQGRPTTFVESLEMAREEKLKSETREVSE